MVQWPKKDFSSTCCMIEFVFSDPSSFHLMSLLPCLLLSSILSCLPLCLPLSFMFRISTSKPSATNIKRSTSLSSAQGWVQAPSINTPSVALTSGTTEVATPATCAAEYYDLLNLHDPVVQPIPVLSDYGAQIWGGDVMTVGVSIEGTVLSEMSKMVALNAESLSTIFCWGFLEGFEEGEGIELVESVYYTRLCRDFYSFKFLIAFEIHGLAEGFVEVQDGAM